MWRRPLQNCRRDLESEGNVSPSAFAASEFDVHPLLVVGFRPMEAGTTSKEPIRMTSH